MDNRLSICMAKIYIVSQREFLGERQYIAAFDEIYVIQFTRNRIGCRVNLNQCITVQFRFGNTLDDLDELTPLYFLRSFYITDILTIGVLPCLHIPFPNNLGFQRL